MKGKIILLFILALVALFAIGYIGGIGLQRMITSIEEASEPNETITGLGEILQDLSDAESSVRAFIITRDPQTLDPFKQSAATVETKLQLLKRITENEEQSARLEKLDTLVGRKYATLSELISVRHDQDQNVLRKVVADIDKLKLETEAEAQKNQAQTQQNDPNEFELLFGEKPVKEDTVVSESSISSRRLNEAINRIDVETSLSSKQLMEKELKLTQQDNAIMIRIRSVMDDIENAELAYSSSRTDRVKEASERTINTITTTLVITLIIFAFLLSVIFNDISRNRRNREQLREAKERAEKLARVKEEFLSNMSHEIRTPLNAIIGFTEQLENSTLNQQQSVHLSRIKSSGDHLLRLINDILDYAKMESGKMELEHRGFKPAEEIQEMYDLFESTAEKKGIMLGLNISSNVPKVVLGDSVRFRQILINLINNSLKFTREGKIIISLNAENDKNNQFTWLKLSVEDTGIGIPSDKLHTIFEDFSQADSSTARQYGGSGLGLSIVNKITQLHQGKVHVSSEVGQGTRFDVSLRYQLGTQEDLPLPDKKITGNLSGLHILIVDDQHYNLELLQSIFKGWKVSNDCCDNGEEALKMLEENAYDLVLLDIQMPGISGLEVAQKFRERETGTSTPIIALTAGTSDEDKNKAKASGMNDFLSKPFTQESLRKTILLAVGRDITMETPTGHDGEKSYAPELDGLMELANGDMDFISNMLQIFRNNFHNDLQELVGAGNKIEKKKVRSLAHKMIPPCGHLGYTEMVGLLRKIEQKADNNAEDSELQNLITEVENESVEIISEIDKKIMEIDQHKARV